MANPEHVAIVKQGREAIGKWRMQNPRRRFDLSGAVLSWADLAWTNLSEADLSGTMLYGADLREANLSGANLSEAEFSASFFVDTTTPPDKFREYQRDTRSADLRWATLCGANLIKANLSNTDLTGADLCRADLSEANLSSRQVSSDSNLNPGLIYRSLGANLSRAKLNNAILTGAMCGDTTFAYTDLREAIGLEKIEHQGPSSIDVDTLLLSKGMIPGAFLRGCGVPETLITYLTSLLDQAIEYYSCFISYGHADKSFARRLHDALQGRGIRCWLDEHQMLPGDDIHDQVDRGIRLWDKTLLCASRHSLTSWWVDREINSAFKKEERLMKERGRKVHALIPIDLDGHLFQWENGKKDEVCSRFTANFTDPTKFDEQIERLILALRADGGGREPPPEPKL